MKKRIRKTLKITGICLLSLIAIAFATPYIFKSQIVALVKKEINSSINAKVEFKDVSLSLFRHFPKLSIGLEELSVEGIGEFEKDTLISAKRFDATVNLFSAIKGENIKVYGVYLESPRIQALVNENGAANWDISIPDTSAATTETNESSSSFKMNIQKYEIKDGYILYDDRAGNMRAEIFDLDHQGSGDLTDDLFTLHTKTDAVSATFNYEGIPYLLNTRTGIGADIHVDNKNSKYSFDSDDIVLNNLKLAAKGFFQIVNDSTYDMDINFNTPSNEFKDILSLIPAMYTEDFDNLKTSGKAKFNGFVKGKYSPTALPAYSVNIEVIDGFFQYPGLPEAVKNIQVLMKVDNPDGVMDHTVVDISKAHIEMGNEPFDLKLLFRNPETIQYIDVAAKGRLNLANITKFIKLEAGTKLAGLIHADVFAKGSLAAIEAQKGAFTAGGFLDIRDLYYASKDFPQPVQRGNMKVNIVNEGGIADNTIVDISQGHIELGNDPFDFNLHLTNPTSTADFKGDVKGKFTLDNLKQFMTPEPGTQMSGVVNGDIKFEGNKTAFDQESYEKIKLEGTAGLTNVKYVSPDYPTGINLPSAQMYFDPQTISLTSMTASYLGSNFKANGTLNNILGYMLNDQTLRGNLNVSADKMNLNDWMGTDTASTTTSTTSSTTTENTSPFAVPANIDLVIKAKADKVTYDKVDYKNIDGTLLLRDETVRLDNIRTEALDGTIAFNGSYSTKVNKTQPDIGITYDIKNVDVQKAFMSFNTVQKLMPIGQFLSGKLSSRLTMTGNLGADMMPDLTTLTGNGNLLLIEGFLMKFKPLETIATTLQVEELKEISIKDFKNYFEFSNGKVLVKPFPLKVKDIEMEIGGMHGLDQSLDYIIQMKLPRKYLGEKGNTLVNGLVTKANSNGVPVTMGEVVNLNINMGGTMTNPVMKTDLKETAGDATKELKQQAVAFAQQKADSTTKALKDSANVIKNQAKSDLTQIVKNQLTGTKDSSGAKPGEATIKKAEETLKSGVNNLFNRKKKVPADSARKNQ